MAVANPAKVVTGKVRFSYANVFAPVARENGDPRYSISLLIPKSDTATINAINQAIETIKNDPKNAAKWGGSVPKLLRGGLRDGDAEKEDAAYAGHFFINANSAQKPQVVDANLQAIIDPSEFYSGAYGRASITFFAYNAAGSKGIGCGLNNVQKLEDGEKLGGGASAEQDFAI